MRISNEEPLAAVSLSMDDVVKRKEKLKLLEISKKESRTREVDKSEHMNPLKFLIDAYSMMNEKNEDRPKMEKSKSKKLNPYGIPLTMANSSRQTKDCRQRISEKEVHNFKHRKLIEETIKELEGQLSYG